MSQKHIKQAARGQKQIYEENKQTIIYYSATSASSLIIIGNLNFFIFNTTRGDWVLYLLYYFFFQIDWPHYQCILSDYSAWINVFYGIINIFILRI
jgi:hypothetical protein